MDEAGASSGPSALVVVDPGRAPAAIVAGAVDGALGSSLSAVAVRVPLERADPRRPALEALCGADERVLLAEPQAAAPAAEIVFEIPAGARPGPRTLAEIANVLRDRGLESVEVPVPGRYAALSGLSRQGTLRARASGSGSERLRPATVGLRSISSRVEPGPPPTGTLAHERAEHLRHRARSATMRARVDRHAHRLSRERLQTRHERTRRGLAERKLGSTGAGEWIGWRSRAVARRAAALPEIAASAGRSASGYGRRVKRFLIDRRRSRKLSA